MGPYQNKTLKKLSVNEFERRCWIWDFQPSQNPITNINDACLFPSLINHITQDQAWNNRSHLLKGEELWESTMRSWNTIPLGVLARSFVMHHHMVNSIIKEEGRNIFTREEPLTPWMP